MSWFRKRTPSFVPKSDLFTTAMTMLSWLMRKKLSAGALD